MKQIKTWQEFYSYVPEDLKSDWNKKCYRKLFSLAAQSYLTVLSDDVLFYFERKNEHFVFYSSNFRHLTAGQKFNSYPEFIKLEYFRCIATGYESSFEYGKRVEVIQSESGECKFDYIIKSNLPFNDVVYCGTQANLISKYYHDKTCVEQVEWENALSYSIYLVIKDHLWFKRGQILDRYYLSKDSYKRSPLELFNYSPYGINRTIACDLTKVTLEQLENIKTDSFSCYKRNIGCDRGCRDYCLANSANQYEQKIKEYFIKTFKRLNL